MAFLSTNSNEQGASRFDLVVGETSIGRHPECGIVVDAGAVSRYHAKICANHDDFVVEDLGSSDGTFVNGDRIEKPHRLFDGDVLRIGQTELLVEIQGAEFQGDDPSETIVEF